MQFLLIAHITGALVTALIILLSFVIRPYKKAIIICGIFQVLSGAFLFAMQPSSIAHFCARVGIYIFLITGPLVYFHYRDHQNQNESYSRL